MKLIWHADNLWEKDWLRMIFGKVVTEEIEDFALASYDDDSIHVISSNWAPMRSYEAYFARLRARCKHIVLVHVSDEWFSGGYALYRYFDLVLRWNHSYLTDHPGVITVPLGYPNNTAHSDRPAHQRQYVWSFIGEIKSSRIAMANAFDDFQPQFITGTASIDNPIGKRFTKPEFDAVLADSVFAPCPMGNATIDTNRVWESLELGCIPLVELRPMLDYYTNLLGKHPIPSFRSWPAARRYAETLYKDKAALRAQQIEIVEWWAQYKSRMRLDVQRALVGPSQQASLQSFSQKMRNRHALIHEPIRIVEILRHQTGDSLRRRLMRPFGPLKRIIFDTSGGKTKAPASVVQKGH